MKNTKCPIRTLCFGYSDGDCDGCVISDKLNKLHKRIDRLKKQNETLTIQRNAWALAAKAVVDDHKWISVDERLPYKDEYLTHHNDGIDTLKRLTIAYMTDTVSYTIGCYDGYKWVNQLGNRKIEDVIAWKPFETYTPPKEGEVTNDKV